MEGDYSDIALSGSSVFTLQRTTCWCYGGHSGFDPALIFFKALLVLYHLFSSFVFLFSFFFFSFFFFLFSFFLLLSIFSFFPSSLF